VDEANAGLGLVAVLAATGNPRVAQGLIRNAAT
jgi:hypothetical protein